MFQGYEVHIIIFIFVGFLIVLGLLFGGALYIRRHSNAFLDEFEKALVDSDDESESQEPEPPPAPLAGTTLRNRRGAPKSVSEMGLDETANFTSGYGKGGCPPGCDCTPIL
eukprot:TRINITY_DN26770_c0_g1_i1.p1 TRINITY_DN26770_c0_g1~~TRINITY_DN26770_c0_g1_i1.p1  ORF type:complete len:111 (-),score=13.34 TRINITY_DN26770_c0_g1_i1:309-641(-)